MKTEKDLKALWHQQPVDEQPDIQKLLKRAGRLTRISRYKLIGVNLSLLAAMTVWALVFYDMHQRDTTTLVGTAMMTLAVVVYLAAYNQLIPILFKNNPQSSTQDYLTQLLKMKRKEEFLFNVVSHIYFALLTGGLALYLIQPLNKMSALGGVVFCVVTFSFMGLAWFYLRPLGEKKKQKYLHYTIEKLESINQQLTGEE